MQGVMNKEPIVKGSHLTFMEASHTPMGNNADHEGMMKMGILQNSGQADLEEDKKSEKSPKQRSEIPIKLSENEEHHI